jgi:hypothetical protein
MIPMFKSKMDEAPSYDTMRQSDDDARAQAIAKMREMTAGAPAQAMAQRPDTSSIQLQALRRQKGPGGSLAALLAGLSMPQGRPMPSPGRGYGA